MPITVAGVPLHPLLVHVVVVLVPLVALAAHPSWNRPYGPLAAAVLGRRSPGPALRSAGAPAALPGVAAVVPTVLAGHTGSHAVPAHLIK